MFHTATFFSGTHLALPVLVLNLGESASLGTGTRMHTLLAVERLLNWLRAWRVRGQGSGVRGQGSGVGRKRRRLIEASRGLAVRDSREERDSP